MQRRDVETEDKGAGRGTAPGTHRNTSTAHAVSLQSAVCLHCCTAALCSLSVVCSRCGVSRSAASSPHLVPRPSSLSWRSYSTHGVNMRLKPCHVRRIGHPCHPKTTVVRCACSSVDLQTTREGARNPQALGVQVAWSLSCFTAAVDPAAHQTTQLQELISSLTISHGISQCSHPCGLWTASAGFGPWALGLGPRETRANLFTCFLSILGGA